MFLPALNLIENTEKSQSSANDKRRTIIHGMRTQDESEWIESNTKFDEGGMVAVYLLLVTDLY